MLKRMFENRDPWLWKDLYVSLVRSDYVVQVWNPHLQGDINKIVCFMEKKVMKLREKLFE